MNAIIDQAQKKNENFVTFVDSNGEPGHIYLDKKIYRNSYGSNFKIRRIEHGIFF
jgi:hypothetical protein